MDEKNIRVDERVIQEMKRLRTEKQLQLCYTPMFRFPNHHLKVTFLNARSLHKHFNDVKCDHSLFTTDIMCFAETRLYEHETNNYVLENYTLHLNSKPTNNSHTRPYHGLAIYVKDSIEIKDGKKFM